jgi:hypothetical protein
MPFNADLGGEDHLLAETIGDGLADDFLGAAEAVDRRAPKW